MMIGFGMFHSQRFIAMSRYPVGTSETTICLPLAI